MNYIIRSTLENRLANSNESILKIKPSNLSSLSCLCSASRPSNKVILFIISIFFVLFTAIVLSEDAYADGAAVGYGKSSKLNAARFSFQKTSFFFGSCLDYWEFSLSHIWGQKNKCCCNLNTHISGASLIYVFRFEGPLCGSPFAFYLEGGAGLAGYTKKQICSRNLGSNALLEFKGGGGFVIDKNFDFGYKYIHNSNAYLAKHNDGLNLHFFIFSYRF